MPSGKKVSWAQLRVGIMAAVAMVILAVLVFLLTGNKNPFAEESIIYTYLDDSAALTEGSAVRLNGILVGQVKRIALSGESAPNRIIKLDLEVQRDYLGSIPVDSMASITAENVLGTKFINIKRGQAPQTIQPGGTLPSLDTREFEEVVQTGYTLLASLQGILKRIDAIVSVVESGQGSIGKLLISEELHNRLLGAIDDVRKVTNALTTDQGTIGKLIYDDALYRDMRASLTRMDTILLELQEGRGTAGRFLKDPALYEDTQKTVNEVRTLLADLNAGKGTAGKFLKSEELHDQISATVAKLDTMIDRMNAGQGTIGQLLVNPALYDSLAGATREMNALMKDFRADPRKFLRIKLSLF
jgi:phospholipid/cholesterol/gamma-HCH transport system substrate-binding protein